jgi:acyl transferase domain-containing protein
MVTLRNNCRASGVAIVGGDADAAPETISAAEAGWTATRSRDEIAAPKRVFHAGATAWQSRTLGSLMDSIGHVDAAAGLSRGGQTVLASTSR